MPKNILQIPVLSFCSRNTIPSQGKNRLKEIQSHLKGRIDFKKMCLAEKKDIDVSTLAWVLEELKNHT